jgi:hypothetical protein
MGSDSSGGPMLGSGGFFGPGGLGQQLGPLSPKGRFGLWPSCGCSSCLIILAGIFLVCAGGLSLFNQ